jgi:adenine-specific DNA-methyltransferase
MQEREGEQSYSRNNVKDSSIKHYQLQDIQPVQEYDGQGNPLTVWQVMFGLAEQSTPKVELYQRIWDTVFGEGQDLTPYLHKKPEKKDKGPGKPIFNDLVDNYDQIQGGQLKGISHLRLKGETYFSELAKREEFKEWGKNGQARYEALIQDHTASGLFHLDRRLNTFYAGNDADFFIHKDLRGFLNQEKERFIQNVIFSDLSGLLQAEDNTSTLQVARAFNQVADRAISFLDAIESFQKHLFELKKKVVDTHYLVSVGKVPAEFYPRLLANDYQLAEWRDVYQVAITTPEELQEHPTLVVDTSLYADTDPTFQTDLLSQPAFDNLDEQTDGLLINSENWQALNLLQEKFREQVKCIYIDPPYNTGGDGFLYKDSFRHSSWAAMMADRLGLAHDLLAENGVFFGSIDDKERNSLENLLQMQFGPANRVEELIWAQNTSKSMSPTYSNTHEYVQVFARDLERAKAEQNMFREPKPGYTEMMELVERLNPEYPPIAEIEQEIQKLFEEHRAELYELLQEQGLEYSRNLDPWRGIYGYSHAEYRDEAGRHIPEEKGREENAQIWIWQEADASMPMVAAGARKANVRDPEDLNYRFYSPLHPETGNPCPYPKTGWRWPQKSLAGYGQSFEELDKDNRIYWGKDENKVPRYKRFLHEVETNVARSVIHDYTDGEKEVTHLIGQSRAFPNPKPTTLIERFVQQTTNQGEYVLDFFAGSGTAGHAVWRCDEKRRFILNEMGEYFDNILKPRMKRVMYSLLWKSGRPEKAGTYQGLVKVQTLEQYEDLLDNLSTAWDETNLPEHVPAQYLYMPEHNELASSLDLCRPFSQTMRIGKIQETKSIDLLETWCYLQGHWMKSKRVFREFDRTYAAVQTTRNALVLFRDIQTGEDDTDNIRAICASYQGEKESAPVTRLEVNHFVDIRRMDLPVQVITADDFLRGTQWS